MFISWERWIAVFAIAFLVSGCLGDSGSSDSSCSFSYECNVGSYCANGDCVGSTVSGNGSPCQKNADCEDDEFCALNNQCTPIDPSSGANPYGNDNTTPAGTTCSGYCTTPDQAWCRENTTGTFGICVCNADQLIWTPVDCSTVCRDKEVLGCVDWYGSTQNCVCEGDSTQRNCGNNVREPNEECEPSSESIDCAPGYYCHPDFCMCTSGGSSAVCGNGTKESGEECEPSTVATDCDTGETCNSVTCQCQSGSSSCGNGTKESGEECEPSTVATDCDAGQTCNSVTCQCEGGGGAVCGNGTKESGEECEPSTVATDCDTGQTCNSVTCKCEGGGGPVCGDGNVEGNEECEPVSQATDCASGAICHPTACVCTGTICGDGNVQGNEQCDPASGTDECGSNQECNSSTCFCEYVAVCGNNTVEEGEDCEQDSHCSGAQVCHDFTCQCVDPECGNGNVELTEECEHDWDCLSRQYCDSETCMCKTPGEPVCGNGVLEAGEMCDVGNFGFCDSDQDCNMLTCQCIDGEGTCYTHIREGEKRCHEACTFAPHSCPENHYCDDTWHTEDDGRKTLAGGGCLINYQNSNELMNWLNAQTHCTLLPCPTGYSCVSFDDYLFPTCVQDCDITQDTCPDLPAETPSGTEYMRPTVCIGTTMPNGTTVGLCSMPSGDAESCTAEGRACNPYPDE